MKNFNFIHINSEIRKLYNEIVSESEKIKNEDIKDLIIDFKNNINSYFEKSKLNIAFVGQYSSGKSTIIKALTGNKDIQTGQDITTDDTISYPWYDVNIVDTPGIFAGRIDHDHKSLSYINKADLLVYTVTIKGFEDEIGKNFRKLAFDENKIDKMMLVLNKSSLEPISNRDNWFKNPSQVIEPATLEELKISCIDAEQYIRSLSEEDETRKQKRIEKSNFNEFIFKLNEFISEKGYLGQLLSPLNIMDSFLRNLISYLKNNDEYSKKMLELLRRKDRIILKTKEELDNKIKLKIRNLKSDIKTKGYSSADRINFGLDNDQINNILEEVNDEIEDLYNETIKDIELIWENSIENFVEKIKELTDSDLFKSLKKELDTEINLREYDSSKLNLEKGLDNGKIDPKLKNLPDFLKTFSNWVNDFTKGSTLGKVVSPVSGSNAHNLVKSVGKFFNIKFKPFGAIKIAEKFSSAGKFVGVAGAILGPALALLEEYNENKSIQVLKDTKKLIRNSFNETAQKIFNELEKSNNQKIEDFFNPEIIKLNTEIKETSEKNDLYETEVELIKNQLEKIKDLFNEIHNLNISKLE